MNLNATKEVSMENLSIYFGLLEFAHKTGFKLPDGLLKEFLSEEPNKAEALHPQQG